MIWPILQAVAITLVFTQGSIFKKLRDVGPKLWRDLSNCPLCTGVWVGMGSALLAGLRSPVQVLGFGAVVGVAALLVWRVIDALDAFANPGGTQEKSEE